MSNDTKEMLMDFMAADSGTLLEDTKIDKSDVILILTREEAKIFMHKENVIDEKDSGVIAEEHTLVAVAITMRLREERDFFEKMRDWTLKQSGMTFLEETLSGEENNGKYN